MVVSPSAKNDCLSPQWHPTTSGKMTSADKLQVKYGMIKFRMSPFPVVQVCVQIQSPRRYLAL
jgi:hypothetical protein